MSAILGKQPFVLAILFAYAAGTATAQEGLIGWGEQVFDSRLHDQTFVQIAAGGGHTVARRSDGSVAAWGNNATG